MNKALTDSPEFFTFAPDPTRAAFLDRRMQVGLAHSLEHILERADGLDGFAAPDLQTVATRILNGERYLPSAFGRYYELVFSLLDQQLDDAVGDSKLFAGLRPFDGKIGILALDEAAMGDEALLIRRRIGPEAKDSYVPPRPDLVAPFVERLEEAIALMDQALPEMAGEFRAIVKQIVLAAAPAQAERHFGSASVYQLWGLMVMNPNVKDTIVDLVAVLAHETGHSLLFGFAYDEALVLNADEETFASPLRDDMRPMDGVYHATFVTARMHWAMSRLAENKDTDPALRDQARRIAAQSILSFNDGLSVVEQHGRLTETGTALMEHTKAYMAGAS